MGSMEKVHFNQDDMDFSVRELDLVQSAFCDPIGFKGLDRALNPSQFMTPCFDVKFLKFSWREN